MFSVYQVIRRKIILLFQGGKKNKSKPFLKDLYKQLKKGTKENIETLVLDALSPSYIGFLPKMKKKTR